MGKFKVEDFRYIPAEPPKLEQGVKNNRTPRGAVAGGYGTFVVQGAPPQVKVYFDGGKKSADIYPLIKNFIGFCGRSHVTEKLATDICGRMQGKQFDNYEELAKIVVETMKE